MSYGAGGYGITKVIVQERYRIMNFIVQEVQDMDVNHVIVQKDTGLQKLLVLEDIRQYFSLRVFRIRKR